MERGVGRTVATIAIAIAIAFALRDLVGFAGVIGFHDRDPATQRPYEAYHHLMGFVRLLNLAVAGTLILKSADRAATRILAGALIGLSLNNNWQYLGYDDWLIWPSAFLNYAGVAYGLMQFIRFAAGYTSADWLSLRRYIYQIAPYVGGWIGAFGTSWWISVLVGRHPIFLFNRLFWAGWDIANVLVIVASLIGVWKAQTRDERVRMKWIAASFCIAAAATAIHGFDRVTQGETAWANYVDTIAQLALPIGLGYAILRHRLLDREFILTGAVTYGAFTILLCAGEVVLEHLGRMLVPDQSRFTATTAEFAISIMIVISYKRFEEWSEPRVQHHFGSSSEARIAALRRFIRELYDCMDQQTVEDRLLRALESRAGADSVALYRKGPTGFDRVACTFEDMPKTLTGDEALSMSEGGALPAHTVGFSMRLRGQLTGLAICRRRTAFTEDELDAIEEAVGTAGAILDSLSATEPDRRRSPVI